MTEYNSGFHPWLCIRIARGATKFLSTQALVKSGSLWAGRKHECFFKGTKVENRGRVLLPFCLTGFQSHSKW